MISSRTISKFFFFKKTGRQRLFTTAVNRVTLKGRGAKTDESLCEIRTKSLISSPNLRVSYYLSTTRHRRAKKVMNHGERER